MKDGRSKDDVILPGLWLGLARMLWGCAEWRVLGVSASASKLPLEEILAKGFNIG